MKAMFFAAVLASAAPALAQQPPATGQLGFAGVDSLSLSPSRGELTLPAGGEKTIVINVAYSAHAEDAAPARLSVSLGDWTLQGDGTVIFASPGSQADSAAAWLLYSPGELTIRPGENRPIRVTVTVPPTAAPGEYLACLFVEPRPDTRAPRQHAAEVQVRYRLAASFYVTVAGATRKGVLDGVSVDASTVGLKIVPRLRNAGTSHVRPTYTVKVLDRAGVGVAELPESQATPVLAGKTLEQAIVLNNPLPPGDYTVRYRVNFGDGGPLSEARVPLTVGGAAAAAPEPPAQARR